MSVHPSAPAPGSPPNGNGAAAPCDPDVLHEVLARIPSVAGFLRRTEPPPGPFAELFARHGLGPRHGRVLIVVGYRRELTVTGVAEQLNLSLPAASLLIGELDRAGLLTRVEDPRDRRRTLVRMHPIYERAAEEWLEARVRPWRATLSRLSPRAREGFIEGWRILQSELDADG